MASLQAVRAHGRTYWRIVESRRVNGKPRPVPIAYLGRSSDILARLQASDSIQLRSRSHGAVAALYSLAQELDIVGTIDRHLAASGRRIRKRVTGAVSPMPTAPMSNDGLTVGQSLMLLVIGRACHATSKRAFARWARTTTLGELAALDNVERLTSQHFWDQMDQLPVETIAPIECELVGRAIERWGLPLGTLLFDATNFFTFIASTNTRPKLPVRGHQKQKRNDLRQVGVALLCSRKDGIPLWHQTYGGNIADATCFKDVLPSVRQRLVDLKHELDSLTIVYDKGNVSRANQQLVDGAQLHYVTALPNSTQRTLVTEANAHLAPVELGDGDTVQAWRARKTLWGAERTAVVFISERLRQGQMRGVLQHVASAQKWLSELASTLQRGKQKRDRPRIQRDIESRLKGPQHLGAVLRFHLAGDDPKLTLTCQFDQAAFEVLANNSLGRVVLVTDRHDWSTPEIIRSYRGQSDVEAVFAHLKDPIHLALRPQHHWTDQKIHVHVFTCILGYLLGRVLHLRALRAGVPFASMEGLLDALTHVRRATVARSTTDKGRMRITTHLEEVDPQLAPHLPLLGVTM